MSKYDTIRDKVIVALDYDNIEEAKKLVDILGDNITTYKVGFEIFLNTNGTIIDYLHEKSKKVFLDLKFHDITNTVKMACINAIKKNIFMFNIHCSNGRKTMTEIVKLVKENNSSSLLIGVTILTNLSIDDVNDMFNTNFEMEDLVLNLANIAKESGMNGIVCSPMESKIIKERLGNNFITVCPGIRPLFTLKKDKKSNDDQTRIMTPAEAIKNNVDYLVIGRPITKSNNPLENVKMIFDEMLGG